MASPRPSKPTLDDVAALVGASRATVSRVLNGGVRSANTISDQLREAIVEAAKQLDYAPNTQAQAMAAGTNRTLAILVTEIDDPGSSAMVSGATRRARELGYSLVVGLTGLTASDEIEALRAIRSQRPKALVVAVSRTTDTARERAFEDELSAFTAEGGRVSVIGQNSFALDEVVLQNGESARALATALVDLGYRRFAVVTGKPELVTPEERRRGFVEALSERGIEVSAALTVTDEFDRDGGYRAAGALVDRIGEIELIFATSDAMALGAIARLREDGIAVPGDVAVAGFDDVPLVRDLTPALTTVRVPLESLAERAVEQTVSEDPSRQHFEMTGELVVRASTPPLTTERMRIRPTPRD
jgi:LacI family transcriptional regulator